RVVEREACGRHSLVPVAFVVVEVRVGRHGDGLSAVAGAGRVSEDPAGLPGRVLLMARQSSGDFDALGVAAGVDREGGGAAAFGVERSTGNHRSAATGEDGAVDGGAVGRKCARRRQSRHQHAGEDCQGRSRMGPPPKTLSSRRQRSIRGYLRQAVAGHQGFLSVSPESENPPGPYVLSTEAGYGSLSCLTQDISPSVGTGPTGFVAVV